MNPVVAGDLMMECFIRLPSLPAADETMIVDSVSPELGGSAFNLCWYLSQLGSRPKLVGPCGSRDRPVVAETLTSAGLDASGLIPVGGSTDLLISMLSGPSHHSVYLRATLLDDVRKEFVARCNAAKYLILSGSRHAAIRGAFIELATAFADETLAVNPSYAIYEYSPGELSALLRHAHVAILNEHEARHACAVLGVQQYDALAKCVRDCLIVTLGQKGARVYSGGKILEIPSRTRKFSSAIGAGDAFFSGFLCELFHGRSLADAGEFAAVLAAYVVESSAVRVSVSRENLQQMVKQRFGTSLSCHSEGPGRSA